MKKSINNQIKALQNGAESQAEFMKKLAEVDENGQLTPAMQEQLNGGLNIGVNGGKLGPLIGVPTAGMMMPEPFPFPDMVSSLS